MWARTRSDRLTLRICRVLCALTYLELNTRFARILSACALLLAGCKEAPPPPQPPNVAPTPHPALAAQQVAVRMYPALAENGSTFNVAFREIYQDRLSRAPRSLQKVDWPIDVANEAGRMLGVLPASENQPPEEKKQPTPTPIPKESKPNALDRGAYNQTRSVVPGRPIVVDKYGRRVYP
jgi:hypothetical protein